ncbi:cation:proton antiporter [Snodgrassella sp. CFCC 13594]|uniref:cation:proton antiporter domain-containing protein n=1 Tax=Snodgrassella sp. CFCC 13594 TaxID=1775559 RepID=UPI0009ECE048|nr:cation:proton antiporter [Snodgrassella sp. CFCC 13594]
MHHSFPLVETIVGGLFFAFILGYVAQKLKMPPLIGYLLAGIIVGPHTEGFTADVQLSQELAELGVILLMFGVGLHFSIKDLLAVRKVALPGAIIQISLATILGVALSWLLDWSWGAGMVFGLALSCASTVVLIAALQRWQLMDTTRGRIATGWLIVEDIAMVFVLVMIPALAPILSGQGDVSGSETAILLGKTLLQIVAFVALMMIGGRKLIPWSLKRVVRTGNPELFRLAVVAIALGCAILANYLFGVSFALGAFFAGMIINDTEMNHTAEKETTGLRDFFTVLFFVSVGMLFDPSIVVREPWLLLATVFIVVIGKSLGAFFIVRILGYPKNTALTISAALAQIGEFSFMIASLGMVYKILPQLASDLILGAALVSIVINPFLFVWLNKYQSKKTVKSPATSEQKNVQSTPAEAQDSDVISDRPQAKVAAPIRPVSILFQDEDMVVAPAAENHTILVGAGPIGQVVLAHLLQRQEQVYVQESRLNVATELRAQQIPVAYGHALSEGMLDAVHVTQAKNLVITISNQTEVVAIIQEALGMNAHLNVITFSEGEKELEAFSQAGAQHVVNSTDMLAEGIIQVFDASNPRKQLPIVRSDTIAAAD